MLYKINAFYHKYIFVIDSGDSRSDEFCFVFPGYTCKDSLTVSFATDKNQKPNHQSTSIRDGIKTI